MNFSKSASDKPSRVPSSLTISNNDPSPPSVRRARRRHQTQLLSDVGDQLVGDARADCGNSPTGLKRSSSRTAPFGQGIHRRPRRARGRFCLVGAVPLTVKSI